MDHRPWLKNYPPGIPANIDHTKYETLVDFLHECFVKYGPNNAFECMGKKITVQKQISSLPICCLPSFGEIGLNPETGLPS